MIGRTVSHYIIQERLGEGGMGVVYRALDQRLNRAVAIKVLRADALADAELKKRFAQEARAASALNHPNIITIYEIDTAEDGAGFIVMEYVPGRTLGALVGRKGLPVGEALRYAVQIASALATAHQAGIIHRDLKPANIMITERGTVKLLDFGLAKLIEPSGTDEAATRTLAPDSPVTEGGAVLGTAAYMSPEQTQGQPLDTRSDIFSFGAVLYEMLTGHRAFERANRSLTITAILRDEPPPITNSTEFMPPELDRAIRRCIRKDREKRIQHTADLQLLLEELKDDSESGRLAAAGDIAPKSDRRWLLPVLAVICISVGVAASWFLLQKRPSTSVVNVTSLTHDAGYTGTPALSPDGKLLAFTSDRAGDGRINLWVKQVPDGEPVQVTNVRRAGPPDFSPDATRLVFHVEDDQGIYTVPALGGSAPRRIASPGFGPRFSPDGNTVAYAVDDKITYQDRIRLVPSGGGVPRELSIPLSRVFLLIWSRDGRRLMVFGSSNSRWFHPEDPTLDWWVVQLDPLNSESTGAVPALARQGIRFPIPNAWLQDVVLLTGSQENRSHVWRLPVDGAGRPRGEASRLTSGTAEEQRLAWSPSGLVAFEAINYGVESIWMLPLDANTAKVTGGLQRSTRAAGQDENPSVTPDGRLAAYQSNRTGNTELWMKDWKTGKDVQLTRTPEAEGRPAISPDGSRVAYTVRTDGKREVVWVLPADGGPPERLCDGCGEVRGWSPDNRHLVLNLNPNTKDAALGLLDTVGRNARTVVSHPGLPLGRGRVSPDGRWIAFEATPQSSVRQIFIAPLGGTAPERSEWIAVTDGKVMENKPEWSPNAKWVYYVSERDGFRCVWARAFDPVAKAVRGEPVGLLHLHASEISMQPIGWSEFDITIARDKLVFNALESRANIQAVSLR